jgi:hypothetical protein
LPSTNRWHPVLKRFVDQTSGRVNGFCGSAGSIPASPAGYNPPGTKGGSGGEELPPSDFDYCGKVTGLIYDRFGEFEGFTLETESGAEERFRCEERAMEDLVRRAWLERYVIAVIARKAEPHVPVSIVTRRAPRPH